MGLARNTHDPVLSRAVPGESATSRDRPRLGRHRRRATPRDVEARPPLRRYRLGRFLALLVSVAGAAGILFGCGSLVAGAVLPASRTANTFASAIFSSAWVALAFTGAAVLMLLLGQIGQAVFALASGTTSAAADHGDPSGE